MYLVDKTTRKYLIQMVYGKLVIFNSTDNYQTPKYETDVSSKADRPSWLGHKQVGNNLLFFKIVSGTAAQLLQIDLPTLDHKQVKETMLQQIEFLLLTISLLALNIPSKDQEHAATV